MEESKRTKISEISGKVGEVVKICGWVHAFRDQGSIKFIILRDVTGIIQCVVAKDSPAFDTSSELSKESVVEVIGKVNEERQAPGGQEIRVENIVLLSRADPELPIPVVSEKGGEETEAPKRFDFRWLDLRKPDKLLIFKIWTSLEKGLRSYFDKENYIQIYTPSFMSTPSESGAEVFEVKYFETNAYLAQSPQFYKQMAIASGFEKVFMAGPVFRAEPSFTTRHMTEFTGWDFELAYVKSHFEVMEEEEKILLSALECVKTEILPSLKLPHIPFPKVSIKDAKEKLEKTGVEGEKRYDLSPEEERILSEIIQKETGSEFVFVTDYPVEARPFYHMRHEDNDKLTKSFDLLYKGVEITTGAQREHRVDVLEAQAKEKGLNISELKNYLDFFKYGCPPHGGGGIGPGRIIMKLLDLSSVKEATFLPRDVRRLTP